MKKIVLTIGLTWLLGTPLSFASGMIIPVPPKPGALYPPALSIKYHSVDIEIENQIARTKVDQVFINPYSRDVEGIYIFPIPEDANISKFSMWVGGEELKGEILDKDEARKIYEEIVRRMKDPGLLEYAGRGAFRARIYPIPARGEKRVSLEYEEILKMDNGLSEYRCSLDPIREVNLTITLSSKSPIKSVYSPTHEIDVKRKGDHRVEIHYTEKDSKPDRDFLLYYTVSKEDLGLNLLTYREKGDKGFFLGMISPSTVLSKTKIIGKDIVFVLDRSGSMSGEKIEQAKSALLFCLNNLNSTDKFSLISFSDEVRVYEEMLMNASQENIKQARKFVRGIEAAGGTDINHALLTALQHLENSKRTSFIIFLTDGLPTVGETNIPTILENVESESQGSSKVFAFGVGYDVNTRFLDRLATENQGTSEYVRPEEDIEVKISNFYTKIANPVLTDLNLNFGKIKVTEVYPKVLPDLFHGSQLLVLGRL
ncbi:VWA domain-containing protein [candidate division TA06 bacterium]|nr:VWA domain-containing protein [candidate division TA06 bacterium]